MRLGNLRAKSNGELVVFSTDGFAKSQYNYITQYFDSTAQILFDQYGFDISRHDEILKDVLWSNSVQHGSIYRAEAFPAWSSEVLNKRSTLVNYWRNERENALTMWGVL